MVYHNPYIKLKLKTRRPYTVVYLIRHCNPDYKLEKAVGDKDISLSVFGRQQRTYLTKHLLKLSLNKLYASGLKRAQETAAPVALKLGKELIIDERVNEIDWNKWYRVPYFQTIEKNRPKKVKDYRKLEKSLDEMQEKGRRWLHDVYKENKGKTVAVFTHGNFIKAVLTGIINSDVIGFLSLEIFQSAISKIVIDRDGYVKINYINDVNHLPKAPGEDMFLTLVD
jgi:broad specificity phosphatase PhoE